MRIAIVLRTALQHVDDRHVFTALPTAFVQDVLKELPALSDKGFALQIFISTRGFPHDHDRSTALSGSKHRAQARLHQALTHRASTNHLTQFTPRSFRDLRHDGRIDLHGPCHGRLFIMDVHFKRRILHGHDGTRCRTSRCMNRLRLNLGLYLRFNRSHRGLGHFTPSRLGGNGVRCNRRSNRCGRGLHFTSACGFRSNDFSCRLRLFSQNGRRRQRVLGVSLDPERADPHGLPNQCRFF